MIYLVDAQLPRSLAKWIVAQGKEAIHTLDLPDQNSTSDSEIIRVSTTLLDCVVVSKDKDFPERRFVKGLPDRLLWVTTGNIKNSVLLDLFTSAFASIDEQFSEGAKFIELSDSTLIVHE